MPFSSMILPRTLSAGHAWLSKRVGRSKNRHRESGASRHFKPKNDPSAAPSAAEVEGTAAAPPASEGTSSRHAPRLRGMITVACGDICPSLKIFGDLTKCVQRSVNEGHAWS
jgi:hypothetical protein